MVSVQEVAEQVQMVLDQVSKRQKGLIMAEHRADMFKSLWIQDAEVMWDQYVVHIVGKSRGKAEMSYPLNIDDYDMVFLLDVQGKKVTDLYDESDETEVELKNIYGVMVYDAKKDFYRSWT